MAKKKKNILKTVATIAIGVFAAPIAGAIGLSGAIGGVVGATAGRVIGGALVGGALGGVTGTGVVSGALGGAAGGLFGGSGASGGAKAAAGLTKGGIAPVAGVSTPVAAGSVNVAKAGLAINPGIQATLATSPTSAPVVASNAVAGAKAVPNVVAPATNAVKQVAAPSSTDVLKAADIQANTATPAGPADISAPGKVATSQVTATGVKGAAEVAAPAMTVEQVAKEATLPVTKTVAATPVTATGVKGAAEVVQPAMTPEQLAKVPVAQAPTQGVTQVMNPNPVKTYVTPKEVTYANMAQMSQAPQAGLQNAPLPGKENAGQVPVTSRQVSNSSGISGALQRVGGTIASNFMTPEGAMALTQMALGMQATPPGLEEVVAQRQQELADAQANDVESYNRIRGIAYSMLDDINRWDPRRMALQRATTEGVRANRASREAKRRAAAKGYFGGELAANDRATTLQTSRNVGEAYNEGWKDFQTAKFDAQGRVAGLLGTRSPTTPAGDLDQVTGFTTDMWTNQQANQAARWGTVAGVVAPALRGVWEDQQLANLNADKNKWGNG